MQPGARKQPQKWLSGVLRTVERVLVCIILRQIDRRGESQDALPNGLAKSSAFAQRIVRGLLPLDQRGFGHVDRRILPPKPLVQRAKRRLQVRIRPAGAAVGLQAREPEAVGAGERRYLADESLSSLACARAVVLQGGAGTTRWLTLAL